MSGNRKTCTKCRKTKEVEQFYRKSGNRDGKDSWCRTCRKEYQRAWRAANLDTVREKERSYRAENRGRISQNHRRYRAANPDTVRDRTRSYYHGRRNKEKALAANRKHYAENIEKHKTRDREGYISAYSETLQNASNHRKEWTGPELEIAGDLSRTAREVALMLGRTINSVRHIRRALRDDPRKIKVAGISESGEKDE
jgi:hypothetical protein